MTTPFCGSFCDEIPAAVLDECDERDELKRGKIKVLLSILKKSMLPTMHQIQPRNVVFGVKTNSVKTIRSKETIHCYNLLFGQLTTLGNLVS